MIRDRAKKDRSRLVRRKTRRIWLFNWDGGTVIICFSGQQLARQFTKAKRYDGRTLVSDGQRELAGACDGHHRQIFIAFEYVLMKGRGTNKTEAGASSKLFLGPSKTHFFW